jgi:hypothetical protein
VRSAQSELAAALVDRERPVDLVLCENATRQYIL